MIDCTIGVAQTILTGFAVVGAWLAALLAWRSGSRATDQKELQGRREEWWRRFQWATGLALDTDASRAEVGTILLTVLARSTLAGDDELDAAKAVSAAVYESPLVEDLASGHTGFDATPEVVSGD